MDKPSLNIVRAADIAAHGQEFAHPWNPQSQMIGTQLARSVGLKRTGVNFMRVPPGKEAYGRLKKLSEQKKEELDKLEKEARDMLQKLNDQGQSMPADRREALDGQEFTVAAGDFIGFPAPSVAHLLKNTGTGDLVYLTGGENREFEVADFPALGKRMVRMGQQVDIYDVGDAQAFGPLK